MIGHFRAVYKHDRGKSAVFQGTREQMYAWLTKLHLNLDIWEIYSDDAEGYTPAREFVEEQRKTLESAEAEKIKARNAAVLQTVMKAMQIQHNATEFGDNTGMDLVAKIAAEKIIKLFEN